MRQILRDHSDDKSLSMMLVCARIALIIINATAIMVASAALSNSTPTKTTTLNRTANTKTVVAIEIRNRASQIPVFNPKISQTPSTR